MAPSPPSSLLSFFLLLFSVLLFSRMSPYPLVACHPDASNSPAPDYWRPYPDAASYPNAASYPDGSDSPPPESFTPDYYKIPYPDGSGAPPPDYWGPYPDDSDSPQPESPSDYKIPYPDGSGTPPPDYWGPYPDDYDSSQPKRLILKFKEYSSRSKSFKVSLQAMRKERLKTTVLELDSKTLIERGILRSILLGNEYDTKIQKLQYLGGVDMVVLYASTYDLKGMAGVMSADDEIQFVEVDQIVYPSQFRPSDTLFEKQWGLHNKEFPNVDIDAMNGWGRLVESLEPKINFSTAPLSTVAVLDSGVDHNHPDLIDQMWTNGAELYGAPGVDDDRNGYVDDILGYDFVNEKGDPMDIDGHGTACAGIIAAKSDNGLGISGIHWRAKIMALKLMEHSKGWVVDAVRALDYAIKEGARVTSNSWGNLGNFSPAIAWAINRCDQEDILFVGAAGNGFSNNDQTPYHPLSPLSEAEKMALDSYYPSSLNISRLPDNVISVAAVQQDGFLAYFSNYGKTTVQVAAPGVDILSTLPNAKYGRLSGTSMACANVAAIASVVWSIKPTMRPEGIKNIVLDTTTSLSVLEDYVTTGGIPNLDRALKFAAATNQENPDPTYERFPLSDYGHA